MLRTKLSVLPACMLVAVALLLSACSSTPIDKTATMTPEAIYADAKDDFNNGAYDKAITLFEKVEGRAAGTPLAQQAQIDKAYAHYKNSEPAQAIATLDRFIKLHPASPALDYVFYLKGIINFNDDLGMFSSITRQDLSERDQKAAKESFEAFRELLDRFPASRYAPDARQRMLHIINSLALYEVHVARYYFSRSAYLAAINRAQNALADYPEAPALEEALFILVRSYDALGMPQLRDDAKRVLEKNYPQSKYISQDTNLKASPWWKVW